MKKSLYVIVVAFFLLVFSRCISTQTTVKKIDSVTTKDTIVPIKVEPNKNVISINELITMFEDPTTTKAIIKKYGYSLKRDYEIYNFDKFSHIYYKNCKLAKILVDNKYEDYPKPLRKGTSSYIAFKDGTILLAVFNQAVYDNLLAQIKAAGFILDMPGNEDIYIKGNLIIGCYSGAKTIRIKKS